MITLVNNKNELSFLPADPYSARITALAETYGTEQNFAMFWVQKIDEIPVAAISRVDGNMTLCCGENAGFEELSCFINAVGYSTLTFDMAFAEKLGIVPQKSSFTVKYTGDAECYDVLTDYNKKDIYALLTECGFELGDYNSFLADVCARLNKSTASLVADEYNGRLCACAFALFEGEKSVLLGAVATSPESRGRGCASKLVGTLAETKKEKEVFLFCRNDSLLDFYKKIGFEPIGKWAIHSV
ncbi:MAG: GNAT family N-acetyltransferase [Acutalibacteraceae bacterium]|nr:GNAT family N-acetyltransferase [Acutalibacteraceae bacterium]